MEPGFSEEKGERRQLHSAGGTNFSNVVGHFVHMRPELKRSQNASSKFEFPEGRLELLEVVPPQLAISQHSWGLLCNHGWNIIQPLNREHLRA